MNKKVIVSWSGGKDSCLAAYKAKQAGYELAYLANTISFDHKRVRFHGLKAEFIQQQAQALGIPLFQKATTPDNYENEYIENLKTIVGQADIYGLVLGDIFLQDCYDWAENICKKLGIKLIEPLWQIPSEKILTEFINARFEGYVVSTQANILGEQWIGKKLDQKFLADIKKVPDIDICGENGEYHSVVIDGPLFRKRIPIGRPKKVLISDYWFWDI